MRVCVVSFPINDRGGSTPTQYPYILSESVFRRRWLSFPEPLRKLPRMPVSPRGGFLLLFRWRSVDFNPLRLCSYDSRLGFMVDLYRRISKYSVLLGSCLPIESSPETVLEHLAWALRAIVHAFPSFSQMLGSTQ